MKSFREQLVAIYFEAEAMLQQLIYEHGKESEINCAYCLQIPEGFEDNIDHTYLKEVNSDYFVTDDGQYYSFDSISMDRFCEIVDALKEEHA